MVGYAGPAVAGDPALRTTAPLRAGVPGRLRVRTGWMAAGDGEQPPGLRGHRAGLRAGWRLPSRGRRRPQPRRKLDGRAGGGAAWAPTPLSTTCSGSRTAAAGFMPNTRRRTAVDAPWPVSTRRPTPRTDRVLHGVEQYGQVTAGAVKLPDNKHIAPPAGRARRTRGRALDHVRRRPSPGRRAARSSDCEPSVFETLA